MNNSRRRFDSPDTLLYFVKYPEPGKVKTRLARSVGQERAAELYRELAEKNLKLLREKMPGTVADFSIILACEPANKIEQFRDWLGKDFQYWPQRGEGLGERLRAAFQQAFDEGASKVLALGSDTLGIKAEILRRAFDALKAHDVVIGPARDGGYYLIGASLARPSLFKDIPWSSPEVFSTTLERVRESNLSYYLLPELEDLDEVKNLERRKILL